MINEDDVQVPGDFDDMANWLVTVRSAFSPSELQGALVGGLSGAMRLADREWTAFGLAIMGADGRLSESELNGAQKVLGGLAKEQLFILSSDDMAFELFLPDEDEPLSQRTESVGQWCKGFLGGFAEAQLYQKRKGDQKGPADIPDNVMEALKDMTSIAQASIDADREDTAEANVEDDDWLNEPQGFEGLVTLGGDDNFTGDIEDDPVEQELAEKDFMEIVEYLRLAVLTVFTEYGWVEVYGASGVGGKGNPRDLSKGGHSGKNTLH